MMNKGSKMAGSSFTNASNASKPPPLSYAERARRASAASTQKPSSQTRQTANGAGRLNGEEIASPVSSTPTSTTSTSRNPNSTPTSAQTSPSLVSASKSQVIAEGSSSTSLVAPAIKSTSAKPLPNVWAARMARAANVNTSTAQPIQGNAVTQSQPTNSPPHSQIQPQPSPVTGQNQLSSTSTEKPTPTNRVPLNGVGTSSTAQHTQHRIDSPSSSNTSVIADDPFVVRPGRAALALTMTASQSPPSLDDTESWPEMGKAILLSSSSGNVQSQVITVEGDKKEASTRKAGERPKWVLIPPSELQAAHDAQAQAHSNTSSRAHSQHRKNNNQNQNKSRSRQHSQARTYGTSNNSGSLININGSGPGAGTGGAYKPTTSTETSAIQSRAESSTHSRSTSVHSSPRFPMRGRRLPEDPAFIINMNANSNPSMLSDKNTQTGEDTKKSGINIKNDNVNTDSSLIETSLSAPAPQTVSQIMPLENMQPLVQQMVYGTENLGYQSGPHSQSATPYTSHSPVYYPPNTAQNYYGSYSHPGPYNIAPPPVPSPKHGSQQQMQQGYQGYPHPYIPQQIPIPHGQPPYSYMYPPLPYAYYSHQPTAGGLVSEQRQGHYLLNQRHSEGREERDGAEIQGELSADEALYTSPVLPPASSNAGPRPPPPQESDVLSGYREITAVPVSPLLNASSRTHQSCENSGITSTENGGVQITFGSVGKPGGLKSPSPEPVIGPIEAILKGDQEVKGTRAALMFANDVEDGAGQARDRTRRATAKFKIGENDGGVDNLTDGLRDTDLNDNESKWEFGTSAHMDEKKLDLAQKNRDQDYIVQQAPQLLQPQPYTHQMLPYPAHIPPPQIGYNLSPQVHLHMPALPLPSGSPQGPMQPLPQHIPSLAPLPLSTGFVSPLALSSPVPGQGMTPNIGGDEWEVRDFGYGFGPMSGTGYIPERPREERHEREYHARDREGYRDSRDYGNGRARRASNPSGFNEGGRGSYSGRRGRGVGNYNRGRGGYPRTSGYSQRHQPSLSVSTSNFQHPIQPNVYHQQDLPNGYYVPPPSGATQFIPSPYGQYNPGFPPVPQPQQLQPQVTSQTPHPVLTPTIPLSTRLLGQIEYYFSSQNLASDIYLRRQMDSKGWLLIDEIASFNRVKQLTTDIELVHEVLSQSSIIEMRENYIRLSNGKWKNYVLPDAAISMLKDESDSYSESQPEPNIEDGENVGSTTHHHQQDEKDEEEDEDDVVFVMG